MRTMCSVARARVVAQTVVVGLLPWLTGCVHDINRVVEPLDLRAIPKPARADGVKARVVLGVRDFRGDFSEEFLRSASEILPTEERKRWREMDEK